MHVGLIFLIIIAALVIYGVKLYRVAKEAERQAQRKYEDEVFGERAPRRPVNYGQRVEVNLPPKSPPRIPPNLPRPVAEFSNNYPPAQEVQQRTVHAQERELARQEQMNIRLAELRARRSASVAKIEDLTRASVARPVSKSATSQTGLPAATLRQQLKNPASLRRAFLFKEILSPPVSLR